MPARKESERCEGKGSEEKDDEHQPSGSPEGASPFDDGDDDDANSIVLHSAPTLPNNGSGTRVTFLIENNHTRIRLLPQGWDD